MGLPIWEWTNSDNPLVTSGKEWGNRRTDRALALIFTAHISTHSDSLPPCLRSLPSFRYRRNRIRNELMPYLREHFNPRADEALARTAEVLQDEVALLEAQAGQLLNSCLRGSSTVTNASKGSSSSSSAGESEIEIDAEAVAGEMHHRVDLAGAIGVAGAVQQRISEPSTAAGSDNASYADSSKASMSVDRMVLGAAPVALQRRAL